MWRRGCGAVRSPSPRGCWGGGQRRGRPDAINSEGSELETSLTEFFGLLGSLNSQQKACIVLRYVTQLDNAGIADALGMREGTVRVQLHRAHAVLRRTLKEADHGR